MISEQDLHRRAKEMRLNPTEWEKRVWRGLSNPQLGHKFRRQTVLYPFIVDFFCPAKGLIVEIEGDSHDPEYDASRNDRLAAQGFATIRFTNIDVRDSQEGVLLTIAGALARRPDRWAGRPHPNPSPEGEGLKL